MCVQINMYKLFFLISVFITSCLWVTAQKDSLRMVDNGKLVLLDTLKISKNKSSIILAKKDSVSKAKHDPHKATLRSAIIPGWGQAYNREYWKIPIVYGALSVPTVTFIYNNTWLHRTEKAFDILVSGGDSDAVNPKLKGLTSESLQYYRNSFRKDRDYSILFFLLAWSLNIADATVFAHLKDFDVSRDLSMHIQPDYNTSTKSPSLGLVLNYKESQKKILPSSF